MARPADWRRQPVCLRRNPRTHRPAAHCAGEGGHAPGVAPFDSKPRRSRRRRKHPGQNASRRGIGPDTEEVVRRTIDLPGLETIALVSNLKGAQRAHAAGTHRVVVPVSVSESPSRSNTNKGAFEQADEDARVVAGPRNRSGGAGPAYRRLSGPLPDCRPASAPRQLDGYVPADIFVAKSNLPFLRRNIGRGSLRLGAVEPTAEKRKGTTKC